jgi:TetR/AcrR family transcriptional regulator, lmrAB and yxaGH operons repressor
MPAALLTREEVVARIQTVFRDHGFEGASLSEIAKATGLGKSSLYHHFPGGKDDMAVAVLARIEAWMREYVLEPLRGQGSPRARLHAMLDALDELYAGGTNACVLGALVTGGSRVKFQAYLQSAFALWIEALRALAAEAGIAESEARDHAEDAVVRIQGALIVAAGLDDPTPFRRALRNVERDLLG